MTLLIMGRSGILDEQSRAAKVLIKIIKTGIPAMNWFIADDVPIVSGRHGDDMRPLVNLDAAIRIGHVDAARHEEADVRVHAVVGADRRFHVL